MCILSIYIIYKPHPYHPENTFRSCCQFYLFDLFLFISIIIFFPPHLIPSLYRAHHLLSWWYIYFYYLFLFCFGNHTFCSICHTIVVIGYYYSSLPFCCSCRRKIKKGRRKKGLARHFCFILVYLSDITSRSEAMIASLCSLEKPSASNLSTNLNVSKLYEEMHRTGNNWKTGLRSCCWNSNCFCWVKTFDVINGVFDREIRVFETNKLCNREKTSRLNTCERKKKAPLLCRCYLSFNPNIMGI